MNIPRELYLVGLAALFLLGLAATAERLLHARRHGYSVRLQIFVPLAATTLALSASFAAIVIDRFQSRAAVFARKAAEDEARVVAALVFALVSAAVAIVLGNAVAIPIERLTRAAQRVAAGERQAVLPEPRGREVRALTHALESMRRELEQRHALEAFVADLSHELKNPIASVRAAAEVLEDAADDPRTARKFAGRIRESAEKLSALTLDLLSLARLEARGSEDTRRRVRPRAL